MASDNLNHRVIPFPTRSASTPQSSRPNPNDRLLKAAKAAYNALLLAVPQGEQNLIVRVLGEAIRAVDAEPEPPRTPAVAQKVTRCENVRSAGYDPTGENGVECRARACFECEECGSLCAECVEEHAVNYPEHIAVEIVAVGRLIGVAA